MLVRLYPMRGYSRTTIRLFPELYPLISIRLYSEITVEWLFDCIQCVRHRVWKQLNAYFRLFPKCGNSRMFIRLYPT